MALYYQDDFVTLYHGDCLEILPTLTDVDAVITDPPYNIGKAFWDSIPDYLNWTDQWIEASSNLLRAGGAFWHVWRFNPPEPNGHPTPKPLDLMERCISSTTLHGQTILDLFAGSGSTLVAAKNLGRKVIGVELEERYCEIIAKRCAQEVLDFGALA